MNARSVLRWSGLLAAGALLGALLVAAVVVVIAVAGGVLTAPPGAWVVRARPLPGIGIRANVPGLAHFATSPLGLRLLDGRTVATRFGRIGFGRDGEALTVACAPCRFDDSRLALQPVIVERMRLTVARAGAQALRGEVTSGAVTVRFDATLSPDRIDVDWRLPPTGIGEAYRLLAGAIPEANLATIDGRVAARGKLRLPQRRAQIELSIDGFEVDGLGTERLANGSVEFTCRNGGVPMPRRVVPGEDRWISPTRSGALLASAVIAAEDQRFHEHEGYDRAEIAQVLAQVDEQGIARGASTITQQLARTLFTGGEHTAARKLRELLYAVEMERTLGKREILGLYLNTVDWGPGICGADAAARVYFEKRPGALMPLEAAWLASILRHPAQAYDEQFLAGAADATRAARVLRQMRALPKAQRARASAQALVFAAPPLSPPAGMAAR
jgi:hypothetical protein